MAGVPTLEVDKVQGFAFKALADITATQMEILTVIADRLGLFFVLAESWPLTSEEVAERAQIN